MTKETTTTAPAWLIDLCNEANARCVGTAGIDLRVRLAPTRVPAPVREVSAIHGGKRIESSLIFGRSLPAAYHNVAAHIEIAGICATDLMAHPLWSIAARRTRGFKLIALELIRLKMRNRLQIAFSFPDPKLARAALNRQPTPVGQRAGEVYQWIRGLDDRYVAQSPFSAIVEVHIVDVLGAMNDACRAEAQPAPPISDGDEIEELHILRKLHTDQPQTATELEDETYRRKAVGLVLKRLGKHGQARRVGERRGWIITRKGKERLGPLDPRQRP